MTKLTLSESFDLVPSPLFWAAAANVQCGENIFEIEFEYTLLCGLTIDSIVQNFGFFSRGTNLKI